MSKTFTVRKLDSRNHLYAVFKYQLKCNLPIFFDMREYCWEQWGPGIEAEHFVNTVNHALTWYPWAWDSNKYNGASIKHGKLYLKDDEALTLFGLRWANG
jgi:hypothetical protein